MVTGRLSGLMVIDCDAKQAAAHFLEKFPEVRDTHIAKTGRGAHFYFQWEENIRNTSGMLGPGIDVRGEGGFVVVPPSIHANGKTYRWLTENSPLPLTANLREALTQPSKNVSSGKIDPATHIIEGKRNETLTSVAGFLRRKGLDAEAICVALGAINGLRCKPPLLAAELQTIAESMARYEPEFSDSFPLKTQTGSGMNFCPKSAAEILAREPQPIDWVWQSYIAEGDLFLFAAYMKVGKSTFIYPLVIAIAKGLPFLGLETNKRPVLVLALEESPRDVELRLKKLGMTPDDPIYIHEGPLSEKELDRVQSFIREKKIGFVLLDSLPYYWTVKSENDNAEILRAVKPLLSVARETGAAVGLIHHESKYGGRAESGESYGDGKSIRGGSALFGLVDQAILLDRRRGGRPTERILKTIGRRTESPPELVVELAGNPALSDPNPYGYRVAKSAHARAADALTNEWQSIENVAQQAQLSDKAMRQELDVLTAEGKAEKAGKGVKNDPYVYRRPQDSFPDQSRTIEETNPGNGLDASPWEWQEPNLSP
jgi:hypothetical protein